MQRKREKKKKKKKGRIRIRIRKRKRRKRKRTKIRRRRRRRRGRGRGRGRMREINKYRMEGKITLTRALPIRKIKNRRRRVWFCPNQEGLAHKITQRKLPFSAKNPSSVLQLRGEELG